MAEKQHYVPKVYLKHFTEDGHFYSATAKGKYYSGPQKKHTNEVCYISDFYDQKNLQEESKIKFIERNAFSYEDRDLSRIFRLFIEKSKFISKPDHQKLIEMYLSIKHRNLFIRNFFKQTNYEKIVDKEISKFYTYKDVLEELAQKPFVELVENIKRGILDDKEIGDTFHKESIVRQKDEINLPINDVQRYLSKLRIFILEPVEQEDYFITSDNPGFTIVDKVKVFNTNFGRFDAVGFPLNSKQLMFLTTNDDSHPLNVSKKIHYRKIASEFVFEYNTCSTFNSISYILCRATASKYLNH